MRNLWISSLAGVLLSGAIVAQNAVGLADVAWPNPVAAGTPTLSARIHYPAQDPGFGARMLSVPSPDGFPVVVFLHGYGQLGNDYAQIGDSLAQEGFIAVMINTAMHSYQTLEQDARGMFPALVAANTALGSQFRGKLNMEQVGLLGHSMGGAVIAYVLDYDVASPVSNPGYTCGLALAPVNPAIAVSGTQIRVPLGIVSGQADPLTPPSTHAEPYYQSVTPLSGLKFHYQMGPTCDHMNIVGLLPHNPTVFERTQAIIRGFYGQFLSGSLTGLESVLGVDGESDPNLAQLDVQTSIPQAWSDGTLRIGQVTRVSVALEGGWGGLLAANSTTMQPTTTLVGTLLIDPNTAFTLAEGPVATQRLDVDILVPNLMALVGSTFAVQGGGATINDPFLLGSALGFEIGL
ncbi:MAG: hypothetical protein ACE37K_17260 [Planctomycetota bacterium]